MTHKLEVEYQNIDGSYDYIDVEFESDFTWQDDSFDHEFGTQRYNVYPIMEDYPTWDIRLFTFEQNWLIAIWLMANYSWIEDRMIKEYEERCEIYADIT